MDRRAVAALVICVACPGAFALDQALDVNQYAHTSWKIRDGFVKGAIHAIAQTPDGYLWLGTEFGLLRFDGIRVVPWQPPTGQHLPSNSIFSLLAARDGTLWIGTNKGAASWKDGKVTQYPQLAGEAIRAPILEDHEGAIWIGGLSFPPPGKLCSIRAANVQCYGEDESLGNGVRGLYEDRDRNLWVGVQQGVWRWKPQPAQFYPAIAPGNGIQALAESDSGALLFGPRMGINRIAGGKAEAFPLPKALPNFIAAHMLRDRDSNVWIGTSDAGLVHLHQGKADIFAQSDGLSGDFVEVLFLDREGSMWVGTDGGLDRFREFAIPTLSLSQGLSNASILSVLADRDGSVWLSTRRGLNRWDHGRITIFGNGGAGKDGLLNGNYAGSLFQDRSGRVWASTLREFGYLENNRFVPLNGVPGGPVYSIREDKAGTLWIANKDQGLLHLLPDGEVQRTPWAAMGHQDYALSLAFDPARPGLWIGFFQGGLVYFEDGQARASYSAANGLGDGRVNDLRFDRNGALWAATEGGVSRVKDGRIATLTTRNGLPCDSTHWMMEDDADSVWMYTTCGLVQVARSELDAWAAAIDKNQDTRPMVRARLFDSFDGVRTLEDHGGYTPHVAKSSDGKLWFLPSDGASVVDPRHVVSNQLPPPVQIEQIAANHKVYWQNLSGGASAGVRLPPLARDLEIDYTALSLAAPEKIRFKYMLEGEDRDWQDAGNRRQAFYTNLPPRDYRFRVVAANNSGLWNETGASFDFSIDPAYYQTGWFRALCAAALLAFLWAMYRYRMHQVAQQFNARLEDRIGERTRIAHELHDTMLQSLQGSLAQMQAARNLFSRRPEHALKNLDDAITMTAGAIAEGRHAVGDLRSSTAIRNDLAESLKALGGELANGGAAAFQLALEGTPRDLRPIVGDEIYRIGAEALRNAFSHARANSVEAELRYSDQLLRLQIRDDGAGIRSEILEQGRSGHYGLAGMRERAKKIGAKLEIWSGTGTGTEIDLSIPASLAYRASPARARWRLFKRK